jgi:hypothetical protein
VFGGTLLPVVDLRQKRHHVRNIPDGIQLIRSNLLRRNRAVPLSPIYHFGLPRKCHRLINQPFDGIFWDRQFADAQSDETYKADFTLVGDIDIELSWSPPIRPHFGLEDFSVPSLDDLRSRWLATCLSVAGATGDLESSASALLFERQEALTPTAAKAKVGRYGAFESPLPQRRRRTQNSEQKWSPLDARQNSK